MRYLALLCIFLYSCSAPSVRKCEFVDRYKEGGVFVSLAQCEQCYWLYLSVPVRYLDRFETRKNATMVGLGILLCVLEKKLR